MSNVKNPIAIQLKTKVFNCKVIKSKKVYDRKKSKSYEGDCSLRVHDDVVIRVDREPEIREFGFESW